MLVLALAACECLEDSAFDGGDAQILGEGMRRQVEGVFFDAWCAASGGEVTPLDPGRLGCHAPPALVVDQGEVSGETVEGAIVTGTVRWAPEAATMDLRVDIDDRGQDALGREIAFQWEGPVRVEAATTDRYQVSAHLTGPATLTRPQHRPGGLGKLPRSEIDDRVTHEGEIDLEVRLESWDNGNCIGESEASYGTVGDRTVDRQRSYCLTPPAP